MKSLTEYIELLAECVQYLAGSNGFKLLLAIVFGFGLGILGYWLSSLSSRLWHRSYHLRGTHHIICGVAALITLIFAVVYVAVDFMEPVAKHQVQNWRSQVLGDSEWSRAVFVRAFEAVKKSGLEDMGGSGNPLIDPNISTIPINKWDSKKLVAQVFSESSLENFQRQHSFLDAALHPGTAISEREIADDVLDYFKKDPNAKSYPLSRAIDLAAARLESQAQVELPNIENYTKRVTIALFFILQLLVFSFISMAAYRSLTATV